MKLRSILIVLPLALSGCAAYVLPTWIKAPLMADGQIVSGNYFPWNRVLLIGPGSEAALKFSYATLPNGTSETISFDGDTAKSGTQNYVLDASKIRNARLVLAFENVVEPGYISIAATGNGGVDCFPNEALAPTCAISPATMPATDADQPSTPLRIENNGFYTFDVTELVRSRIENENETTFVIRSVPDPVSGAFGKFEIGSKEFSRPNSSLSRSAQLLVTLTDASSSPTNFLPRLTSNLPQGRWNIKQTSADQQFKSPDPLMFQSDRNGEGIVGIIDIPEYQKGISSLKKFTPSGTTILFKQSLVGEVVEMNSAETNPRIQWRAAEMPEPQRNPHVEWAPTWGNFSFPPSTDPGVDTYLKSAISRQSFVTDISAYNNPFVIDTFNNQWKSLGFSGISTTNTAISLKNNYANKLEILSVMSPSMSNIAAGGGSIAFLTDDLSTSSTYGFITSDGEKEAVDLVYPDSFRARVGKHYNAPWILSVSPRTTSPNKVPLTVDMHFSTPSSGPSAEPLGSEYTGLASFSAGAGGIVDITGRIGYFLNLSSLVANNVSGSYKAYFSMAGHNARQAINFVNLPLPMPSLAGPEILLLPLGQNNVGVASDSSTPFTLAVDDSVANLNDDTTKWNFSSSVPEDVLPANGFDRGDGFSPFSVTFVGFGPRTLTVQSEGASHVQAFKQVLVQAETRVSLSATATSLVFGQDAELEALVQGPPSFQPDSVRFENGAQLIGEVTPDSLQHARLTVENLPVGTHNFVASYLGNGSEGLLPSASTILPIEVARADTVVNARLATTGPVSGATVAVFASVDVVAPGSGKPSGSVTISSASGTCSFALPDDHCSVPVVHGAQDVTTTWSVSYSGDANFNTSDSSIQILSSRVAPVPTLGVKQLLGLMLLISLFSWVARRRFAA